MRCVENNESMRYTYMEVRGIANSMRKVMRIRELKEKSIEELIAALMMTCGFGNIISPIE